MAARAGRRRNAAAGAGPSNQQLAQLAQQLVERNEQQTAALVEQLAQYGYDASTTPPTAPSRTSATASRPWPRRPGSSEGRGEEKEAAAPAAAADSGVGDLVAVVGAHAYGAIHRGRR